MKFLATIFLLIGAASSQNFQCPPEKANLTSNLGDSSCISGPSCAVPVKGGCSFQILTNLDPATQFAQVIVYAGKLNPRDRITVTGAYTYQSLVHDESNANETTFELNAAFPFSTKGKYVVTIQVSPDYTGNSSMTFGYYVRVQNIPSIQSTTQFTVTNTTVPQFVFLDQSQVGQAWEVKTSKYVRLDTAVYSPSTSAYNLLNVWVYTGIGANKTFLAPLYSSGLFYTTQVTLVYVFAGAPNPNAVIVVNDGANLEKNCPNNAVVYYVASAGTPEFNGLTYSFPGCFTIINYINGTVQPLYLTDIIDTRSGNPYANSNVYVLAGAPDYSLSTKLATYNAKAFATTLSSPQQLTSFATTFVTTAAYAQPVFATSVDDYNQLVVPHKQSYISSPRTPMTSVNQAFSFWLNSSTPFTFNLRPIYDMNSESQIFVTDGKGTTIDNITDVSSCNKANACSYTGTYIKLYVATGLNGNPVNQGLALSYSADMACPSAPLELQPTLTVTRTYVKPNSECSYTYTWSNTDFALISQMNVYNLSDADIVELRGVYDTVRVSPSNSYTDSLGFWIQYMLSFPGGKFTLYIKTAAASSLSFEYTLKRQPTNFNTNTYNYTFSSTLSPANDAYYIINGKGWFFNFQDPKISHELNVLAIAPQASYALQTLNFVVYDAADKTKCYGSLYSAFNTPKVFNATNGIVIYLVKSTNWVGTIIVNDQRNLAGCARYAATYPAFSQNVDNQVISVNATTGPFCLTVFNNYCEGSPIITAWSTEGGASPFAIAGAPTVNAAESGDRVLARFGNATSFTVPQIFYGRARTFYVDKGRFIFGVTTNATSSNLYQAPIGRKGFINTGLYPFYSDLQDGRMSFQSTAKFELFLNIPKRNYTSDAVLTVTVPGDLNAGLNVLLAQAGHNYTVVGSSMTVTLKCDSSNGADITYQIGKYVPTTGTHTTPSSVSPGVSGLLAVIITSMILLSL